MHVRSYAVFIIFLHVLIGSRKIGPQVPPLTTTIGKILRQYPEGGQILKVQYFSNF